MVKEKHPFINPKPLHRSDTKPSLEALRETIQKVKDSPSPSERMEAVQECLQAQDEEIRHLKYEQARMHLQNDVKLTNDKEKEGGLGEFSLIVRFIKHMYDFAIKGGLLPEQMKKYVRTFKAMFYVGTALALALPPITAYNIYLLNRIARENQNLLNLSAEVNSSKRRLSSLESEFSKEMESTELFKGRYDVEMSGLVEEVRQGLVYSKQVEGNLIARVEEGETRMVSLNSNLVNVSSNVLETRKELGDLSRKVGENQAVQDSRYASLVDSFKNYAEGTRNSLTAVSFDVGRLGSNLKSMEDVLIASEERFGLRLPSERPKKTNGEESLREFYRE